MILMLSLFIFISLTSCSPYIERMDRRKNEFVPMPCYKFLSTIENRYFELKDVRKYYKRYENIGVLMKVDEFRAVDNNLKTKLDFCMKVHHKSHSI